MKRSLAIIGILVAGLSLLLYFQLRSQRMAAEGLPGSSATIEGTEVDVVSRVGGRIASVEVREGDEVAVGQEVVTLDCPEQEAAVEQAVAAVARAKAELQAAGVSVDIAEKSLTPAERRLAAARASAQASAASKAALRARLSNAQRQEQRMENLVANGVGTPEALDRARALVEELRSQLDALESQRRAAGAQAGVIRGETRVAELQVDLARQRVAALETEVQRARAALEGAQAIHEECSLTAPRDGYVSTRNYEPGEVVLPGAAILTLVDIRVVEEVFYGKSFESALCFRPVFSLRAPTAFDRSIGWSG